MKNEFSIYNFDYDYDRTSCTGCTDYCRCTKIINLKLTNFTDYSKFLIDVLDSFKLDIPKPDKKFYLYAVERMFKFIGLDDLNAYEASSCGGYYGEETSNKVRIDPKQFTELQEFVELHLASLNKNDIIKALLVKEYGYVLDSLKEVKDWEIKTVPYKLIMFPNKNRFEYTTRVDTKLVARYRELDLDLPKGLAMLEGENTYRIIDGYHRLIASDTKDKVMLLVAVF